MAKPHIVDTVIFKSMSKIRLPCSTFKCQQHSNMKAMLLTLPE